MPKIYKQCCEKCGIYYEGYGVRFCSPKCAIRDTPFRDVNERFWEKVKKTDNPDDCYIWQGCRNEDGYGQFRYNRKHGSAHRIIWELTYGAIPNGMCVLHVCDNPACVNINHLFLGTPKDNSLDRSRKDRGYRPRGEISGKAKLTNAEVSDIKIRLKNAENRDEIAKHYKVCKSTIGHIATGRTWTYVI